jgi:hypothetical protein
LTLTVATPGVDPITTLDNGIKIVRCAEYVGGARGTLSTVADSLSVSGTVVKDEQTLAAATTTANRFGSVSDSVTIPVADFDYPDPDASYVGFLGLRSEGSTPVGAKMGERFQYYLNNVGPSVMLGRDGSVDVFNTRVPKWIYEHYTLVELGGFGPPFDTGVTDINIRAWGITNGADPMSWYLDVLYLVPNVLESSDDNDREFFGAWSFYVRQDITLPATDDVTNDIGQYSVLYHTDDGTFQDGEGMDIQTDDDENTESDWHDIFTVEPERESSWVTIVGTGSRLIQPFTVSEFDFSTEAGTFVQTYELPDGFIMQGERNLTQGWEVSGGAWRSMGPTSARGFNDNDYWALGQYTQRTGFSAGDPSTYAPQMGPVESFVLTMKLTLTSGFPVGGAFSFVGGGVEWSTSTSAQMRRLAGVEVKHSPGGTTQARLCYSDGHDINVVPDDMAGAGFTTVLGGLGTGGSYWVKVERRFYHWRAKVWLDGSSEPGAWTLEAYQPIENGFGGTIIQYPWLTGWTVFPNVAALPVTLDNSSSLTPMSPGGMVWFYTGFNSIVPQYQFEMNEIHCDYNPDTAPGGSGTYTGAYYHLEKFDGSEDWGTAYVPPGALQVLYTDYAPHHFGGTVAWGTDIHGGNFMAWRETGGKLLQAAAYSQFFFRRPAREPQWGDLKYP